MQITGALGSLHGKGQRRIGRRTGGRSTEQPTDQGKRILFHGSDVTVIDGPFSEAKEVVAGFSIWEVKDMDEAVAWARRSPNPTTGRNTIEIRPFFEAADLAEFMSPEELAAPRTGERGTLGVA